MKKKSQKSTLEHKEELILCLNDHWVVLIKPMLNLVIILSLAALLWFGSSMVIDFSATVLYLARLFAVALALFGTHQFFLLLHNWELSNWIVTTKRVIDFQNVPFIRDDVTFINIDEIHEIEKRKHGLLANLLDFGDININLAATPTPVSLRYIPHPGKFVNLVESIRDKRLGEEIEIGDLQNIYRRKYRFTIKN